MSEVNEHPKTLTCFKAYDVRGELGVNLDATIAYRIGRAVAQHFSASNIVVGFDARETSPELAAAVMRGICDAGSNVFSLGLARTEEMYWAVTEFNACAGIQITASHNPINYNGLKIVKSGYQPLDDQKDFQAIKTLAENRTWVENPPKGYIQDISKKARKKYVQRVLSFRNHSNLKPLKFVMNSGNGATGPTFDAIADVLSRLDAPLEFIRVHHEPDHTFPNGIPNPSLTENHTATGDVVKRAGADFGVAFDGDFDRCFFLTHWVSSSRANSRPLLCCRLNRFYFLAVNLDPSFFAHKFEQHPDAGITGHLLHSGDETFKRA